MGMSADAPSATPPDETAALRAEVERLRGELGMVQAVLDAMPYGVYWKDSELRYRGFNRLGFASTGLTDPGTVIGKTDRDMPWPPEATEYFIAADREALAGRRPKEHAIESMRNATGQTVWVENYKAQVLGPDGAVLGVVGTFRDITAQKLAEEAALAEQREALEEMATPLLPVADGVVVLPLIGTLDPRRADQVMQTLLTGVSQHRARVAIVDITGLHTVDTTAAEGLLRAARAIRLLGAEAIVTGVRPAVAQTLVALGTDLGGLVVLGDLKAGIAHAIGRTQHARPEASRGGAAGDAAITRGRS